MLSLALSDSLFRMLLLVSVLSLALLLWDFLPELLVEADPDALMLSDLLPESRSDALVLILVDSDIFEILSERMLLLKLSEAERLVDLLVLALSDSLRILLLCDADSDAALSD
ncbi:MAG: hypothetical protein ACOYBD_11520 [Bilifractor sp.]